MEAFNALPEAAVREICGQLAACVEEGGLFHFHENPNPACPVGRNIHAVLDSHLADAQAAMENELKKWGEPVGFAVKGDRVTYVGLDYLEAMENPY